MIQSILKRSHLSQASAKTSATSAYRFAAGRIYTAAVFSACLALVITNCRDPELDARSTGLIGNPAPAISLQDSKGATVNLADFKGKVVVLEWINFDCPFVRKHYDKSNNMQTLQKKYTEQGVVWLSINSSAPGKQGHFDSAEINKRMQAKGSAATAYLLDSDGKVGRAYGAQTTPHMYIIDTEGVVQYQGAIDSNSSASADTIPDATNYVAQGLDELLAGKALTTTTTKSYGCSVKYGS
ncbi:MAG: thioredoxin family protein [bacterium]|nr:thioredoxin family protein [bacterium]